MSFAAAIPCSIIVLQSIAYTLHTNRLLYCRDCATRTVVDITRAIEIAPINVIHRR